MLCALPPPCCRDIVSHVSLSLQALPSCLAPRYPLPSCSSASLSRLRLPAVAHLAQLSASTSLICARMPPSLAASHLTPFPNFFLTRSLTFLTGSLQSSSKSRCSSRYTNFSCLSLIQSMTRSKSSSIAPRGSSIPLPFPALDTPWLSHPATNRPAPMPPNSSTSLIDTCHLPAATALPINPTLPTSFLSASPINPTLPTSFLFASPTAYALLDSCLTNCTGNSLTSLFFIQYCFRNCTRSFHVQMVMPTPHIGSVPSSTSKSSDSDIPHCTWRQVCPSCPGNSVTSMGVFVQGNHLGSPPSAVITNIPFFTLCPGPVSPKFCAIRFPSMTLYAPVSSIADLDFSPPTITARGLTCQFVFWVAAGLLCSIPLLLFVARWPLPLFHRVVLPSVPAPTMQAQVVPVAQHHELILWFWLVYHLCFVVVFPRIQPRFFLWLSA
ncbi:unnamed protein product [Closterium sp. NIES-54]